MSRRAEIARLRREHVKAHRLWRITRKLRHWQAMQRITTAIVAMTGKGARA